MLLRSVVRLTVIFFACGRTPATQQGPTEIPRFVFVGSGCADAGIEAELTPAQSDSLALVEMEAQTECSGAGGDWLIGREVGTSRHHFTGSHACFLPAPGLHPKPARHFAVVRYQQTAALFRTPMGWCIEDLNGNEPVVSDSKSLAWGVFATEAGARAAYEKLEASR